MGRRLSNRREDSKVIQPHTPRDTNKPRGRYSSVRVTLETKRKLEILRDKHNLSLVDMLALLVNSQF